MISGDTIAAIATAPGRSGVAIVRVSGSDAFAIAQQLTSVKTQGDAESAARLAPRPFARHALFYDLSAKGHPTVDEGVLLLFKGPHSYTGEDVVEFQCHGGCVSPRRVLASCLAAGARLAHRGEFTERAFLNGRLTYDQAESVLDLIDAKTARAAEAAWEGLSGRKRRELQALYDQALTLSSTVEHALDIDESELPSDFMTSLHTSLEAFHAALRAAVEKAAEGRLLRCGALVVLAGPPNAGKSSLMNALLEENRAIVSDLPGTTRDSIEEGLDLEGWPIRLVDTAGLRAADESLEAEGIKRAEALIQKADVVLLLADASALPGDVLSALPPARLIALHAKCDLGRGPGLNVSAKTGEGLAALKQAIVAKLEARVASADSLPAGEVDQQVLLCEALSLLDAPLAQAGLGDLVLLGNLLRHVSEKLGSFIGAVYTEDLLDNLFSRFCVGK